jgi:MSHA pilin protein MshC
VVTGSKFFGTSKFSEMGFADTAANGLRYAHKLALASHCDTRVQITSGSLLLFQRAASCNSGAFTRPVNRPGGPAWNESVPSGVTVSALDIYFDSSGSPHAHASGAKLTSPSTLTIGSRTVTVEAETGYVHQ